jgi:glycosyltransferase involved in cell wall biosynthesis
MRIALDWQISSWFGWGVYGLNLALEWAHDPEIEASGEIRNLEDIVITDKDGRVVIDEVTGKIKIEKASIVVDRMRRRALIPFVQRSLKHVPPEAVLIQNLGNELRSHHDRKPGGIGAIFFEQPLSAEAVEKAKRYDVIVAGSTWNAEVLKGHCLDNVVTIFQGVDRSLFHPAPKRGLYPGRFLIFSGGKAEPRKGQDLVAKAFRVFAERHKDAMLVTAWHSPWPELRNGMDLDFSDLADRVIDVGAVPNGQMAPIYRECNVALFPNRAEGGTNLVAMECIACGVPTIVSRNTGHRDLDIPGTLFLEYQRPPAGQWTEWGESSVAEIVTALEVAYRNSYPRIRAMKHYDPLDGRFLWEDAASELAAIAKQHQPRTHHVEGRKDRHVEHHAV